MKYRFTQLIRAASLLTLALAAGCGNPDDATSALSPPDPASKARGCPTNKPRSDCAREDVSLEGTLRLRWIDLEDGSHQLEASLEIDPDRILPISITETSALAAFQSGDRIRARGTRNSCDSEKLALQSASPAPSGAQPLSLSRTFGEQKAAILLLHFVDAANPRTAEETRKLVFEDVNGFLRENSFGQTWLSGSVYGPYTIAVSKTSCDPDSISSAARAAAVMAGADLSQYARLVYFFPKNACGWLGLGTVGGYPSESWINDSFTLHTTAHELGHNLGLWHANALDCGASASVGANCSALEYADPSDAMGNRVPGHFTAYQKERLGWLGYGISPTIQAITSSGTYLIGPYEGTDTLPKALKIPKAGDVSYYLEFRQPLGFDQVFTDLLVSNNLTQGLLVHTGSSTNSNSSFLLSMNPQTRTFFHAGLNPSQTFTDPYTGMTILLVNSSSSGAEISVTFPSTPPPCRRNAPALTLTPAASTWVTAGTAVDFTATLTNQDTGDCPNTSFQISYAAPEGLQILSASSPQFLLPGQSATASFRVGSSSTLPNGSYPLTATLTHGAAPSLIATAQVKYQAGPDPSCP